MTNSHLNIPYTKNYSALFENIFEACLLLAPLIAFIFDDRHNFLPGILALFFFLQGISLPILEIRFLFSTVPLMQLTQEGIHFYYPFHIGFVNWMELESLSIQKIHWKHYYCFTFQNPKEVTSRFTLFERLLFYRIYRKHGVCVPLNKLPLSQEEFFDVIEHYSNVAPDDVEI